MKKPTLRHCFASLVVLAPLSMTAAAHDQELDIAAGKSEISADPTGLIQTINAGGRANNKGAFFQSLGTNGRSCATCHVADQAMSISPPQIRERYERTNGRDPLFAAVDGANCTNVARNARRGHSLLLKSGLIRIPINIPANAQFTISVVKDPYGCALVS